MGEFPVGRTRDEVRLYLDLTACGCGALDADWQHGTGAVDGELVSVYDAVCAQCGRHREYTFSLPERENPGENPGEYPNFGGPEPSQLIDAGRWLALADQLAGNLPADDPDAVREARLLAVAAIDEVLKFVPATALAVPAEAFWTAEGRALRAEDPARFELPRLQVVRATYEQIG